VNALHEHDYGGHKPTFTRSLAVVLGSPVTARRSRLAGFSETSGSFPLKNFPAFQSFSRWSATALILPDEAGSRRRPALGLDAGVAYPCQTLPVSATETAYLPRTIPVLPCEASYLSQTTVVLPVKAAAHAQTRLLYPIAGVAQAKTTPVLPAQPLSHANLLQNPIKTAKIPKNSPKPTTNHPQPPNIIWPQTNSP
jgi:hypothetical protein